MAQSEAQSTKGALATQWRSWTAFTKDTGGRPDSPTNYMVLEYYHDYFQTHTVASYWPIDSLFRKNLFRRGHLETPQWPPRQRDAVKRLERGLRRQRPFMVNKKAPVTRSLLHDLHSCTDWSSLESTRRYTMIALATVCMFRVSELALLKWQHLQHDQRRKVWWIRLTHSKTINHSKCGFQDTHIFNVKGVPELRALDLLHRYQTLLRADRGPITKTQPMFPLADGKPPTRASVTADLRRAVTETGHAAGRFSVHSCRAGGFTILLGAGYPPAAVQAQGRWLSTSAAQEYFREAVPEAISDIWNGQASQPVTGSPRRGTVVRPR